MDRRRAPCTRPRRTPRTSVEAVYAARAGVRFALDVGVEAIRARSRALSDQLIAGADALGIWLGTPRDHAERAGVVCLGVRDPSRVAEQLRARDRRRHPAGDGDPAVAPSL